MWPPPKNTEFTLHFTLYKRDGTVISNPGTITKKISIDGGAIADIAASVTEEDTTYGQLSLVFSAAEMNGDAIWFQIYDDTPDCQRITGTIYTGAAAAIADAVWDEALAGHATGGSAGAALSNAGSAGDPWSTAVPGAYGAGSAGHILGTRLVGTVATGTHQPQSGDAYARLGAPAGASVSADIAAIEAQTDDIGVAGAGLTALASAANLAIVAGYLDTEIAAIKAKTDALPASPAAVGSAMTLANDAVSADALSAAAVDKILDEAIGDGTLTMRQALRVMIAALGAKLSGAGTTTVTIRNAADSANVIVATVDADGNRSAVTLTP